MPRARLSGWTKVCIGSPPNMGAESLTSRPFRRVRNSWTVYVQTVKHRSTGDRSKVP